MTSPDHAPDGLRERKKRRSRQAISDVATRLFVERGFDAVTVAEIARAAEVAENTVYNYFPTKEDLFFDRAAEVEEGFSRAVRGRPRGVSIAAALRRDFFDALERAPERVGLSAGMPAFWSVVDGSPRLQARQLAMGQRAVGRLADELVAEGMEDSLARVIANLVSAVPWALRLEIRRRLVAGEPVATVRAAVAQLAEEAFDLLEHGLGAVGA